MGNPIDRGTLDTLMDAGRAAVEFNSPMSTARADSIVESIAGRTYSVASPTMVDFGCGRGRLIQKVVERSPGGRGLGLDTDETSLAAARHDAATTGLAERVNFQAVDASAWKGVCDVAICVGSSHIFGGPAEMFKSLAAQQPEVAVVGLEMWEAEPTAWCLEQFGEMAPGIDSLGEQARAAGWQVEAQSTSSLAEWDGFEETWIGGVRSLGTDVAVGFASERYEAYQRYRGVLGFGWLTLVR
ncbi:MAG: class I SAM-dependent methyltransferase [Actinobacteria bacterium]|nr:class I SAM-dependent methyltransferase [Actinomycetota bacterium]